MSGPIVLLPARSGAAANRSGEKQKQQYATDQFSNRHHQDSFISSLSPGGPPRPMFAPSTRRSRASFRKESLQRGGTGAGTGHGTTSHGTKSRDAGCIA
jgi:hypothetical protein